MRPEWLNRLAALAALWRLLETAVLALLVCGMVLLAALQILLRNFFNTGFSWADPLLGVGLLWLTMIGALVATGARKHINIDLVSQVLPKRWRRFVIAPADLFASVVCGWLGVAALRFVEFQKELEPSAILDIPLWKYDLVIPVCLFLMSARFLIQSVVSWQGRPAPETLS